MAFIQLLSDLINPGIEMDTKFAITRRALHFNGCNQSQSRSHQIAKTEKKEPEEIAMVLASPVDAEMNFIEVFPCTPLSSNMC